MPRLVLLSLAVLSGVSAAESVIEPGTRYVEILTPHLRSFVPSDQAEALRPVLVRADGVYESMAKRAGYRIERRLDLLLSDSVDDHNGFSTVVPRPLVQVDLAPALPGSFLFDGADHLERTLIHEFAHHLSNDRNHGFRGVLETIFGRVLPFDELSLLVFYLSTPAHVTMPRFWHEGLAQWAETDLAPADSVWGGRGRDPLTHMVWRLDAAADGIPPVGTWRISHTTWPFGAEVYLYGIAYFRWLEAHFGSTTDLWRLIEDQADGWAFAFTNGPKDRTGQSHVELLREARVDLQHEQELALATIRTQPVTAARRLTAVDCRVGPPAWVGSDRLILGLDSPYGRGQQVEVDAQGSQHGTWQTSYALGAIRSLPDGSRIWAETPAGTYPWADSRLSIRLAGSTTILAGRRLLQPDLKRDGPRIRIAAIQLMPAGGQRLTIGGGALGQGGLIQDAWRQLPTEGRPWSPAFRPGHDELAWVETDRTGSRLILASLADPGARSVLASVPGRILHPAWSADGNDVFLCADHSGVANAYLVSIDKPGELIAVTNTIGGVVACVPSPDGGELAIIDHDRHGPFLARIANNPATRPGTIPAISCSWPAPISGSTKPVARLARPVELLGPDPASLSVTPYHGLPRMRPLFWTPTTLAAPDGGYGLLGVAADPLYTHQAVASVGIGPGGYEAVGQASYFCSTWPIELGLAGWQSERTYNDLLLDITGDDRDYVERFATVEAIAGRGLSGFGRRLLAYVSAGAAWWRESERGAEEAYGNTTIVSTQPFIGDERFVELVVAYDDTLLFPMSYAGENGVSGTLTWRHSGFGGDLERDRLVATGNLIWSIWPSMGHQIVLGGQLGLADGDPILQGAFSLGGILGLGLPRGYHEIEAVGNYLAAGSIAYRLPVWRPFSGLASSPWVHRQVVLEAFYDAASVSTDEILGDGQLYESIGGEIHDEWEFYGLRLQPGLGVAQPLDGDQDILLYFTLAFRG